MTLQERRATGFGSTVLLTGITLCFAGSNCGGGSSTSAGSPDSRPAKDTAPVTPDTAPLPPDASPDAAVIPPPDTALVPDASQPKDTVPDTALPTPDVWSPDVSKPDATPDSSRDGGAPDAPFDAAGDGPVQGTDSGADADAGETGPSSCQTPTSAIAYSVPAFTNIAWDKDGSLVTASLFYGDIVLGGKPLTNAGSADMFVAKLDSSTGNASWALSAGDNLDQYADGMAVSAAGIGVIGHFKGTLPLGAGITNASATFAHYIAGVDSAAGTGTWAKKVNLQGGALNAVAGQVNKDYFVVCGGAMNTAANLSTASLNLTQTPGGGNNVVVAAVKASDGTVLWSKLFGGDLDQTCTAATLDDDGNAILAGTYTGTLDFGLGALTPAPTDATTKILWVAKLKGTDGTVMAAKSYGTTGIVMPTALAADAQGNPIVGGYFTASVTFGSKILAPSGTGGDGSDALIVKLDAGLSPSWARRWGRGGTAACRGVAFDSQGNPTVVGSFTNAIDVGPGTTVLTAHGAVGSGYFDAFVVNLDGATGTTLCSHNYGDATSSIVGSYAIAINRWASGAKKDDVAIVGSFNKLIDFGPPTLPLSSGGGQAFLLQM
jgi:hypothetical protein